MNPREEGFLLLTSGLGRQDRHPLTVPQFRNLADRASGHKAERPDRDLSCEDLMQLGYGREMAQRIVCLLGDTKLLREYLHTGEKLDCVPITRVSEGYPPVLRKRLGLDSPGCLWAKGNLSLLPKKAVALVGSREIRPENAAFAAEVGRQAALQGYVLVSGNARGADRIAQRACLEAGGSVISVVSDPLYRQQPGGRELFLSENGYDEPFSTPRALSRNRVIHALAEVTFVAQCEKEQGGSWDGSVKNLRFHWSPVCCFDDGSEAASLLCRMGASEVSVEDLKDLAAFCIDDPGLFD